MEISVPLWAHLASTPRAPVSHFVMVSTADPQGNRILLIPVITATHPQHRAAGEEGMRLLAQGAQLGHTQAINTWQSNPRDTPRTQHQPPAESRPGVLFYGIPAQVDFL